MGKKLVLGRFFLMKLYMFDPSSHLDVVDLLCPPSCLFPPPLLLWTRTCINRNAIT